MKSSFGASPDGIIQACFKLAYHRIHGWNSHRGEATGRGIFVYESCQTKRFLCGRTEVIRTTTLESNAWVEYMMRTSGTKQRISKLSAELLRASAAKHVALAKAAASGNGVDRHLFSLYNIHQSRRDKEAFCILMILPGLLLTHSVLSTSNLSCEAFSGVAFGPVVQDGYGIAYCLNENELLFGISNFCENEPEKIRASRELQCSQKIWWS